jgi:hypothetical protein
VLDSACICVEESCGRVAFWLLGCSLLMCLLCFQEACYANTSMHKMPRVMVDGVQHCAASDAC